MAVVEVEVVATGPFGVAPAVAGAEVEVEVEDTKQRPMAQEAAGAEVVVEVIGPRTVAPAAVGAEVEVQATGTTGMTIAPKGTEITSPGIGPSSSLSASLCSSFYSSSRAFIIEKVEANRPETLKYNYGTIIFFFAGKRELLVKIYF